MCVSSEGVGVETWMAKHEQIHKELQSDSQPTKNGLSVTVVEEDTEEDIVGPIHMFAVRG